MFVRSLASRPLAWGAAGCLLALSFDAFASQRHFGFIQESAVLNAGAIEIEPWTTWRFGRVHYYSGFDNRLEFEFGVAQNLQSAFYWNFSSLTEDLVPPGLPRVRSSSTEFQSVSSEWKYKLSDPVGDALGSGLYFEASLGPARAELEGRLIADKQIGSVLLAANIVAAREWTFGDARATTAESRLDFVAGAGYFVTPAFVPALAARCLNSFDQELQRSVFYLGPSLSIAREGWWASLSVEPQIAAFKGASSGRKLDLDHDEKLQTRLLLGFDL